MGLDQFQCSSPPLLRTPLLSKNSVLITEVSFGEREHHMDSQYLLPKICVLKFIGGGGEVLSRECPLREGPL